MRNKNYNRLTEHNIELELKFSHLVNPFVSLYQFKLCQIKNISKKFLRCSLCS